jgi:hypothetical protein
VRVATLFCVTCLLFLAACSSSNSVTGNDNVTGGATQSETTATASANGPINRIVVSYNDESGESSLITYPDQGDRTVFHNASLMGWSYSDNLGVNWIYGGKVTPPGGWAVLWGDPALTTDGQAPQVVFLSNLAVPNTKMPAGGIQGLMYNQTSTGPTSPLGGACIAQSNDGGQTFANYQCVSNTQSLANFPDSAQGHFYDGGEMASNSAGEIFAAYIDVYTSLIDVYRSPNANGSFQLMPTPFPGEYTVVSHPRLRTGADGSLYVAAQVVGIPITGPNGTPVVGSNPGYYVYMNRWFNGAWGIPFPVSLDSAVYPGIDFGTTVQGSELTLRTAEQFGFDVGVPSAGGNDAIRVLYTRTDAQGHLYLDASACNAELTGCYEVPGWGFQTTGPGGAAVDAYNPDVVAFRGRAATNATQAGPATPAIPPTWQASWAYHYGNLSTINVDRATLGYIEGSAGIFPAHILQDVPVCSDTRGYWGDYDAMFLAGIQDNLPLWMRFSTDSSSGCIARWGYTALAQHVQEGNYSY